MRFQGPELIVDAAVAKLRNNMPGLIQRINIEDDDQVTVDIPKDDAYYTASKRLYAIVPCVVVFDGRTGRTPGRQEGPHQVMTDTLLGVYVIDQDMDEEHLDRKLKRMNAAAIEALLDGDPKEQLAHPNTGSTVSWQIQFRDSQPSPAFHPDGDGAPLRASRLSVFNVTRLEQ
jgi:hypothetical protein